MIFFFNLPKGGEAIQGRPTGGTRVKEKQAVSIISVFFFFYQFGTGNIL